MTWVTSGLKVGEGDFTGDGGINVVRQQQQISMAGNKASRPQTYTHMHTYAWTHTHTHALMSCRDQKIRLQPVLDPIRLSNMSANSHSVPSAVEKGTHRQQEHKPVEHLLNIWQKTDSLGNRAQGQPFPFPTRELSDWWFGCISKVRLWRDNRNVPGWQCIHAQLCYRKGPLSSEPSATLEMTVASLKLPDCLYNLHIHIAEIVMLHKSVKWHHGRHETHPCHISQISRVSLVTSKYRYPVFSLWTQYPDATLRQGESEDASWVLNTPSMDSPKIQAVLLPIFLVPLNTQKPKARFSHQGRIFRLQILRRGGQHWPNLQLWIMSFTGLTQNIQSLSGKRLKHLGEYLHISLTLVFIFSFLAFTWSLIHSPYLLTFTMAWLVSGQANFSSLWNEVVCK